MATAKEKTRKEELFEKLTADKLTAMEKIELSRLLMGEAEADKGKELEEAVADVKKYIQDKGYDLALVVEALTKTETGDILFKVPYQNKKGKPMFYHWAKDKKAVGISASYYQKLRKATHDQKLEWATELGKTWLASDEGKRWEAGAE